jgi:hypothetical protein
MRTPTHERHRARAVARAVAIGCVLAVVLAGCRGGGRPTRTTRTVRPTPTTEPTTTTTTRPPMPTTFAGQAAWYQQWENTKRPWFCNSVGNGTPPSGHGNGGHVHPFYEGKIKGPLSWPDCLKIGAELDSTVAATRGFETKGKAEAAGWRQAAPYIEGLGTHHVRGGGGMGVPTGEEAERIRQCLVDKGINLTGGVPNFSDPAFIAALRACGVDLGAIGGGGGSLPGFGAFDAAKPPILIYGGKDADAPLVGAAFVFTGGPTPPEAYAGGNDWWHLHTKACFGLPPELQNRVDGEHLSDEECRALGGTPQALFPGSGGVWLLHLWMVPPYEYRPDLFVSGHPCLAADGALPQSDPCWTGAHRDPGDGPPPVTTTSTTHPHPTPTTGPPVTGPSATSPTTAAPTTAAPTTAAPTTMGHGDHGH